jgi:hypothetical protein
MEMSESVYSEPFEIFQTCPMEPKLVFINEKGWSSNGNSGDSVKYEATGIGQSVTMNSEVNDEHPALSV